ncbi:hypothetical protein WJX72_007767 [[Myrmecia] bisecta]|uniref:AAA+ ATPase domain-containing protein n=1 Tax=[Myrmecia] bisecta TaxID=41462 RepID=A0AAW1QS81_9CHLO
MCRASAAVLRLEAALPTFIRRAISNCPEHEQLVEVVLDLGRPPLARFPSGDVQLLDSPVTLEDLQHVVSQLGEFGGDNRAGIDRTLHRISCIRNRDLKIIGLTCRVGRAVPGSAAMVADLAKAGHSILLLGRPGIGKTTAIREISRMLAEESAKRVVIIDTSNEIGGDGDIPHPGIGRARRMQVPVPEQQHRVMIEAVENHMPEVIIIDEIGTLAESAAARTIAQRGVQLVGTAHGIALENLIKNPSLSDLLGGIASVTLGDDEARRRGGKKSVLERAGPPTFDTAIEILERNKWRVHTNLAHAVDRILAGGAARGESNAAASTSDVPEWRRAGEEGALHLFVVGMQDADMWEVVKGLGLQGHVVLTESLEEADAVLALRARVKEGSWVRDLAKRANKPIYAIKTASTSNIVRALRTLLGIDPSPGTVFARQGDPANEVGSDPFSSSAATPRAEGDIAQLVQQQQDEGTAPPPQQSSVVSRSVAQNSTDALEEARLAMEQIVLPRGQPIELLPRAAEVLEMQIALVRDFELSYELVGAGMNLRLRILPRQLSFAAQEVSSNKVYW